MRCAVYRYYDENRVLLYVGCSVNPHARMSYHMSSGPYSCSMHIVNSVEIKWFASRMEAQFIEARAILREKPVWNKMRPTHQHGLRFRWNCRKRRFTDVWM